MPKQETFFKQESGTRIVEVLKSYDQNYAKEAFGYMGDDALHHLWQALKPEEMYEVEELPKLGDSSGEAESFLWDELLEQAREDGNLLSFFVVNESVAGQSECVYVSPDWPSAESFAKSRVAV